MRRLFAVLIGLAAIAALVAPEAWAGFGLRAFDVQIASGPPANPLWTSTSAEGGQFTQAGGHPYSVVTHVEWNSHLDPSEDEAFGGLHVPDADIKDTLVDLPLGMVGNPTAIARCSAVQLQGGAGFLRTECPTDSQVGLAHLQLNLSASPEYGKETWTFPVFNMAAPSGLPARFGFKVGPVPVYLDGSLRQDGSYGITVGPRDAPEALRIYGSDIVFWGDTSDPRHDAQRCNVDGFGTDGTATEAYCGGESGELGGPHAGGAPLALLRMPTSCTAPGEGQRWVIHSDSWESPGAFSVAEVHSHLPPYLPEAGAPGPSEGTTGCNRVPFGPDFAAQPTTLSGASSSGLEIHLRFPQDGILNPDGVAQSDLRKAVVTLPEGMQINPSQAEGLGVCGPAEYEAASLESYGCPSTSKIGTVEVKTPLLEETVPGNVYVAKPYENPSHSLIALYIVLREPERGIAIKLPGEVSPDPSTGQITAAFVELPQLPFESFAFKFREGQRAPLITPTTCGRYATEADFYPWARPTEAVHTTSTFEVTSGSGGGACPSGAAPFDPGFEAGTENNAAGSYSPFLMRLSRSDGEQDMGKFSFTLPPGVVPKLAGIGYCSDTQIARARGRQGRHGGEAELAHPSCPAATQIGTTLAAAGVGSQLTYVPGKLYLAGPYHGDPISAVAIVPAVAGPFDAGVVVVREALRLNPVTHVGEVDGSASDPIPHILKGIPLNVREVRVSADRPGGFTLNPTSCEPFQARSTIWGDGTASEPLAPHPVDLSTRFQAAGCASLGFKPKLGIKLRGGTKRGKFPALRAVYTPRKHGDSNLSRLALTFPNSAFIEQGHFRTICTRVQFAAGNGFGERCPKGSVYGHIKVWTPLLDQPLKGPVYLRSSNHNLPDAVFALHGLVDIELSTRIDSVHGRLRAIVAGSPDAPVSRAIVDMQGGQKGLFVNSTNLCVGKHRARVNAGGQNGKREVSKPLMRAVACRKHRVKRHGRHHKKRARVAKRSAAGR